MVVQHVLLGKHVFFWCGELVKQAEIVFSFATMTNNVNNYEISPQIIHCYYDGKHSFASYNLFFIKYMLYILIFEHNLTLLLSFVAIINKNISLCLCFQITIIISAADCNKIFYCRKITVLQLECTIKYQMMFHNDCKRQFCSRYCY